MQHLSQKPSRSLSPGGRAGLTPVVHAPGMWCDYEVLGAWPAACPVEQRLAMHFPSAPAVWEEDLAREPAGEGAPLAQEVLGPPDQQSPTSAKPVCEAAPR